MSRGMPSMTALLGLLAIAGYQNRDKLAEMLNGARAGNAAPASGADQPGVGGLMGNLGGLLGGVGVGGLLNGGIGELLEKFKQNGEGDTAQSWVNDGPNFWSGFRASFRRPWTSTRRAAVCPPHKSQGNFVV
jgi:uncharacterized protein YidB (DUF937 family)